MRFDRKNYIVGILVFILLLFTTNVYANSVDATAHQPGGSFTVDGETIISGDNLKPAPGVSDLTIGVTPGDGYQIADIILDQGKKNQETSVLQDCVSGNLEYCTFDGANVSYTFVGLADGASHTLDAYFALNPVASFEIDSTSPPSGTSEPSVDVKFNDTSENNPAAWLWEFGDGATSTAQNPPMHTYTTYGTYTVTLTVYNDLGQPVDTSTMDYSVVQPTITYNASAGSNGSIAPSGAVVVNEGTSTTFTITPQPLYQVADVLVDGVSIGAVTSHTFPSADIADHTISATFEPIPMVADFSSDPSSANLNITSSDLIYFTDMSQNNPTSRLWDFGDGSSSTELNPVHTFADPAPDLEKYYTVTLTVGNGLASESISADYLVKSNSLSSSVMQFGTSKGFSLLQTAYDDIVDLPEPTETIMMKASKTIEEENLVFDQDVIVILKGGYDDSFTNVIGHSKIKGNVKISNGTVIMSKVIIGS